MGRQNHQRAVAGGIFDRDVDGLGVAFGAGVAQNIDWILMAPVRRQERIQLFYGRRRQFRQFASRGEQRIGGQHSRAAGVGDNRQPRTSWARLLIERLGEIKKLRDGVDAQHAAPPESSIQNVILAGQRAGVRRGGLGGSLSAPGLDYDDGLGERHLACRRQERSRIPHRFHVQHDAARFRIVTQILDQVAPADVEHGAHRYESAEAHHLAPAPVENRGAQSAALADEAQMAGASHGAGERGIELAMRAHQAQAIRPDDAHTAAARLGQDLVLQRRATLADFAKSG